MILQDSLGGNSRTVMIGWLFSMHLSQSVLLFSPLIIGFQKISFKLPLLIFKELMLNNLYFFLISSYIQHLSCLHEHKYQGNKKYQKPIKTCLGNAYKLCFGFCILKCFTLLCE